MNNKYAFLFSALIFISSGTVKAEQAPNTMILKDGTVTKIDGNMQVSKLAPNQKIQIHIEPQAWQTREAAFTQAVNAVSHNPADANAKRIIEKVLTDQTANSGAFTPMGAMDILGAYYLPRDGVKEVMPMIVKEAFLGWFDALQWGTESGKTEIVINQKFFSRVFQPGGGQKIVDEWMNIVRTQPWEAKRIVDNGLRLGIVYNRTKGSLTYDRKWPTAFGLERILAATGGKAVAPITEPRMEYVAAQKAAVARVEAFYLPAIK